MAKQGLIKDSDGKGLTRQDALNLYNELNKIHEQTKRATNYTRMQVGQEFNYTADEIKVLAKAAGYEIIENEDETKDDISDEETVPKISENQASETDNRIENLKQKIEDNKEENNELRKEIREQRKAERTERREERQEEHGNVYNAKTQNDKLVELQPAIKALEIGPSNDPNYEIMRLSLVEEDFNANGQIGKISQGKYYINGIEVSKDVYEVAKTKATSKNSNSNEKSSIDQSNRPNESVNPQNDKKKLTIEDIQKSIDELKPGEEFKYQLKSSLNWGTGRSYTSKPVIWQRLEDGTLNNITYETYINSAGRIRFTQILKHYSEDGKTLLSQENNAKSLKYFKELRATTIYQDGKPINVVTDLKDMESKNKIAPLYNNAHPVDRLLSSVEKQSKNVFDKFSSQELKNTDGETVVYFKAGKFFDSKDRQISYKKGC